jgi:hypothetical protein
MEIVLLSNENTWRESYLEEFLSTKGEPLRNPNLEIFSRRLRGTHENIHT